MAELNIQRQGRKLYLISPPPVLKDYSSYFQSVLKGKQLENGDWEFSARQEKNLFSLLKKIQTGEIVPESQVPLPSVSSVNPETIGEIPPPSVPITPFSTAEIQSTPPPTLFIPPEVESTKKKRTPKVSTEPVMVPSEIIARTTALELTNPLPTSPKPLSPRYIPTYNPRTQDPGESDEAYARRIQVLDYLVGEGLPESSADVLARLRNNVDIDGVSYDDLVMKILNQYLPIE